MLHMVSFSRLQVILLAAAPHNQVEAVKAVLDVLEGHQASALLDAALRYARCAAVGDTSGGATAVYQHAGEVSDPVSLLHTCAMLGPWVIPAAAPRRCTNMPER